MRRHDGPASPLWSESSGPATPRSHALRALADPHGHRGLRPDGLSAPAVFDGPIDNPSFLAYVEQVLVPTLRAGDVVVLDNLAVHKQPEVRAAIAAAGAQLRFLPPYSPDFNPIELAFATLKAFLRAARPRPLIRSPPSSPRLSHSTRRPNVGTTSATPAIGSLDGCEKCSRTLLQLASLTYRSSPDKGSRQFVTVLACPPRPLLTEWGQPSMDHAPATT